MSIPVMLSLVESSPVYWTCLIGLSVDKSSPVDSRLVQSSRVESSRV